MNQIGELNLTTLPKCDDERDCILLFYIMMDLDELRLFIAFPLSIITFVLNIFSFKIFMGNEFKNHIYTYLRVYCINSAFISIYDSLFYVQQRKYGNIGDNVTLSTILVYGYNYLQNFSSYFNNILDIIILTERINLFSVNKKYLKRYNDYVICFISLVFCAIICLPYIAYYKTMILYALMNSAHLFQFNGITTSDFYNSLPGKIYNYGIYFLKDVLMFIIEIIFNIMSILLLRRHLLKKKNLTTITTSNLNNNNDNQNGRFDRAISRAEEKMTILVIVMSSFSFFQHFAIILFIVYSRVNVNFSKRFLVFYSLSYTLKNFANFFLFYLFNPNFRAKVKNLGKNRTVFHR